MSTLLVVENPARWEQLALPGVELVSARSYLVEPRYSDLKGAKVYNLCRGLGYQTTGYYVSLLAAARGHRPIPSVATIQDLRLAPVVRLVSQDLEGMTQRALAPLKSTQFELSIYFGRNLAQRYDCLAKGLFNQFPAPLLRATFRKDDAWKLQGLRVISSSEIPETHRDFVVEAAGTYFAKPLGARPRRRTYRFEMAILVDPEAEDAPSDEGALRRFARAARAAGVDTRFIGKDDYGRLPFFDALFIRETTAVNHHTYRFSRRASAEGLVVIDDPESIVRCSNKIYQAELFAKHNVPTPKSMVVHEGNLDEVVPTIGLPCVVKRPDAAFSAGVEKAATEEELRTHLGAFLEASELALVQEYAPSAYDWRIGVLDKRPLYACRYHMVRGHWQIARKERGGPRRFGRVEAVPLEEAPRRVLAVAAKAASLIGDGLYGIDLKEIDGKAKVIEVNDNPNLDAGCEDAILKEGLYDAIVGYFVERLEARGRKSR